jgi:RND family efflux transporter MFP subunit
MTVPKKNYPFIIIGAALVISFLLNYFSVSVETGERIVTPLPLRVESVYPADYQMIVKSQGNVTPLIQTRVTAEIAGIVTSLSESLIPGGAFNEEQLLISIDKNDYLDGMERAQAEYDLARSQEFRTEALALENLASQADLDLKVRALRLAQANLERANRDLERTSIYAPFDGTVVSKNIDIGQFINRGSLLATIYSNQQLQIRLPIPSEQLGYIFDTSSPDSQIRIAKIYGNYAGRSYEWRATVISTEAEVDAKSQMTYLIGRIENNSSNGLYGLPPVGIFLNADIEGLIVPNLIRINRNAVRPDGTVATINNQNRLNFQDISVFRMSGDEVYINPMASDNLNIITSSTSLFLEGALVNPITD